MRIVGVAVALSAMVLSTAVANADTVQKPWSLRVGLEAPSQAQAKTDGGNYPLTAGLDYSTNSSASDSPGFGSVYFDYSGGSSSPNHLYTYGVGVAARSYGSNPAGNPKVRQNTFYGAGVGYYETQDKDLGIDKTKSGLGGKVFTGTELSRSLFAELDYTWLPKANNADPSNASVSIGIRF